MRSSNHEFIIVGAGPCGCSLSARLAATSSVLLLEAGGPNNDPNDRLASERHIFWATPQGRRLDYGYQTLAQQALNGRRLPYHRGKGLGGSTATNLGIWDYGSKTEMERWAHLVGNKEWEWKRVKGRMRKIENYHDLSPPEATRCSRQGFESHGTDGPVDITLSTSREPSLSLLLEAFEAYGFPLNEDLSSDQAIGFGVPPATILGNERVTASSAFLLNKPANLHILTNSPVARVLFDGFRAVGVEVYNGAKYYASKEVILCAGAIDTPKLLLLSGIGPAAHLAQHNIPLVSDLPGIGSHLMDHPMIRIAAPIKDGVVEAHALGCANKNEDLSETPTQTGGSGISSAAHGYFKLDVATYPGFQILDEDLQRHLTDASTPAYELVCRISPNPDVPGGHIWNAVIVIMNAQSLGRVFLNSSRPEDPPSIDLNLLSHPYDLDVVVGAVKQVAEFLLHSDVIELDGPLAPGPQNLEDENVMAYVKAQLGHLWHAAGTVKMGKSEDRNTCVTPDFKVAGVKRLRVVDLSILPILPSNHTQTTAYLVGETAADTIMAEYSEKPNEVAHQP